ncbi:MAG: dolichyl-phosphate beta-D-mannosyltransferase [Microbacterium sp.]|nr:MAG: dolichyl-phosphate beta-D-mannosyltransferase [Microbacterium sp.]
MHVVLIPAYEPGTRLVELVRALADESPVLVVDDGSGPRYAPVFAAAADAGAVVVAHDRNRGKGAALRTGFAHVERTWPGAAVVTADADGQHTPADIARVAAAVESPGGGARGVAVRLPVHAASIAEYPHELATKGARAAGAPAAAPAIVLGARGFAGEVPLRSRLGNWATRGAFRLATGEPLQDTQTGLRGFPASTLPWLQTLPGDRFEYEFAMLLRARAAGVDLVEVPIDTVYLDGNNASHFRPLVDSARVYGPLLAFTASALLAFTIDTLALLVLNALTGWLLFSVVAARVVSAGVNFAVNRAFVFDRGRHLPTRATASRYFSLAGLLLAANYGILSALTDAGVPMLIAKVATETTLFVVSYSVQRAVVFAPARE